MLEVLLQPWPAFFGLVIFLFAIDLLFGSRGNDLRTAALWSAIWVGAGLIFGFWIWATQGGDVATAYYTAYVLEKSLSIDNVFVFVLIFSELRIPASQQHRVLLLGIIGALVMRAGHDLARRLPSGALSLGHLPVRRAAADCRPAPALRRERRAALSEGQLRCLQYLGQQVLPTSAASMSEQRHSG